MSIDYDVIVMGAGPAGEHCAGALAAGGLDVAIVERELVAGECSYYACIPSKTLLRPGEALTGALAAPGAAQAVSGRLDAAAALEWRNYMVSDYDDSAQAGWLAGAGIDLIRGDARLSGAGVVEVDGRAYGASRRRGDGLGAGDPADSGDDFAVGGAEDGHLPARLG